VYQLVYVSSATGYPSRSELAQLLERAREKNERLGITGMLLYRDGDFMQALEGETQAVRALYETICQDERHERVVSIVEHEVPERSFADWRMGFREVSDAELRSHPGFTDFLDHGLAAPERITPGIALRLLTTFSGA